MTTFSKEGFPSTILKTTAPAQIFFIFSIWYAVLVDLPFALERILIQQWRVKKILKPFEAIYDFVFGPFAAFLYELNTSYQIPWFKLGKDILFLCSLFFLFLCAVRKDWRFPKFNQSIVTITYFFLLFLIPLLAFVSWLSNGFWTALAGLRSHLALLALFLPFYLDERDLKQIWTWITPLFLIQFVFVLVQTGFYRTVGTFRNPNTFGLFLVVYLLPLFFFDISPRYRVFAWGTSAFMLTRSKSRMAIILGMIVFGIYLWSWVRTTRWRYVVLGLLVVSLPLIPIALEKLTGRQDTIANFFQYRVKSVWNYLTSNPPLRVVFGEGLGRGTKLLRILEPITMIPPDWGFFDNQIGSLLVSGGLLLVLVTLAFVVSPLIIARRGYFSLALTAFTLAAVWAIPLWEAWPTNLLIMLLYGYFLRSHVSYQ